MDFEIDQEFFEIGTIEDHIRYGKDQAISHNTLHTKAKFKDRSGNELIHCGQAFVAKYIDLLQDYIVPVKLSEEEAVRFRYRPKTLSLAYYGTTELWSSILLINHMDSVVQFNKSELKLFTDDILDVLEEILILEADNIQENKLLMEKPIDEKGIWL